MYNEIWYSRQVEHKNKECSSSFVTVLCTCPHMTPISGF